MDQQAMNDAMREAVAKALHPYVTPDDHATACTAVIDAVKERLVDDLPAIILHAAQQPAAQQQLLTTLVVPLLHEIEDTLNDDHDAPATPEPHRAGLRRATRTIREIRRAIETGETPA